MTTNDAAREAARLRTTGERGMPAATTPPSPWVGSRIGLRIVVDGTTHPIHDDATGAKVTLVYATGETAEVQVVKAGAELVVIVAGTVDQDRDSRGNVRLRVFPDKS